VLYDQRIVAWFVLLLLELNRTNKMLVDDVEGTAFLLVGLLKQRRSYFTYVDLLTRYDDIFDPVNSLYCDNQQSITITTSYQVLVLCCQIYALAY